ncbi:endolytic transglycosylase MltG [Enterococcus camelliae]|uniref:Endolytic murein transglycosylase n=1 Tax=Enterococcus camelliae TaxID=453959 RepID=A0ABW5TI49_9ENTE
MKKEKKVSNPIQQNAEEKLESVSDAPKDVRRSLRRKEDKIVRKITISVLMIVLIIGGILVYNIYNYITSSLEPLNAKSDKKIEVVIPNGSSNKEIGEILEKDKVIKSGMVFNYYTKFNNLTGFQAGTYQFAASMALSEISKALKDGDVAEKEAQARITIPEGYDIDQIADVVAKKTSFSKNDFLTTISDNDFFQTLLTAYPNLLQSAAEATDVRYRLEGYLFPATYNYYENMTLKELVASMVAKTDSIMSKYYTQIKQKNLSVHEVLTLASLVEKEGVKEDDRKNIAQVFFNRIAADMPLQSDISILYSLGEHKEDVTIEDTQVDSPYNLYNNTGYGPGPFDNSSEQSIQAVLNPTANNYYYFVADMTTGKVYFSATYDEHLVNKEKYVDNR